MNCGLVTVLCRRAGISSGAPETSRFMSHRSIIIFALVAVTACGGNVANVPVSIGQASKLTPDTNYAIIYSFKGGENGFNPLGTLLESDGIFYGTTLYGGSTACYGPAYGCGTFFSVTADRKERVLYHFKPHGSVWPSGGLIEAGGAIYGVAGGGKTDRCGGNFGCGTVYEISKSGQERTVYTFQGGPESDGSLPQGQLRYLGGKLYGATFGGGTNENGTIFELTLDGKERVLYRFKGGNDGSTPQAGLIDVNGTLYGTTSTGGGRNREKCIQAFGNTCGTVFSITPAGDYRVLYRFGGGNDAAYPAEALAFLDGEVYGTSFYGGGNGSGCAGGCGTVFEVNPASGQEHVIYRFKGGTDGYFPAAPLLPYRGRLYGTTALGGTGDGCLITGGKGCGTLFVVTTSGVKTILYQFSETGLPNSRLSDFQGNLYSTTPTGGAYCHSILGCGSFYRLTLRR
jgi:uncharacterized repeat protein (TIGR03803 family)